MPDADNPNPVAYCDSDFANDPDTFRSTTGYVIVMARGPIGWKSKLQSSVVTSTVHAEYMALYDAVREIVWLRQLLDGIGFRQTRPTTVYEDNDGCVKLTKNNRTDARTKHIVVKYHYTCEQERAGTVRVKQIPTAETIAAALTKLVSKPKFVFCIEHMGIKCIQLNGSTEHSMLNIGSCCLYTCVSYWKQLSSQIESGGDRRPPTRSSSNNNNTSPLHCTVMLGTSRGRGATARQRRR